MHGETKHFSYFVILLFLTVMLIMCWLFLNEGLAAALSSMALQLLKYRCFTLESNVPCAVWGWYLSYKCEILIDFFNDYINISVTVGVIKSY